ncbi:MAG: helix-turn-helix transcriptional regulator [Clostridiales bacterium]|jgi:transcriptional regulator with XRE-family HTH domain|nr:helix-turn-helix transcriptional regulator [Eubacteriales bacterium]MDH7566833.1 helix-turn-helix transcriptional regulator [Clostridiales bacterium]
MATIWNYVGIDPCQRPAFTKYELNKKIKEKRVASGLSVEEFSQQYDISAALLVSIEEAKRSFNVPMYEACARILGMELDELLKTNQEDLDCVRFKSGEVHKATWKTVEMANVLFNEMVMQHKISAR